MNEKAMIRQQHLPCIMAVLLYLAAGGVLIQFYRYQINPDGISYISVAQKYLNGDFKNAVNGHFSPLFSWLLVPFLFFGIDPLLSAKLLNLGIGAVTLGVFHRLCCMYSMRHEIRSTLLFTAAPVLLYFAFDQITPDLLVACVLLFYFQVIFDPNYAESRKYGLFSGIFGGIAFLAKSFSFAFFLCHFPLMSMLHYNSNTAVIKKKGVLHNFAAGMLIFIFVSGLWIAAITEKFGYLTISNASTHNLNLIGQIRTHHTHFVPPPNETAISIWEDPSFVLPPVTWNPFESANTFKHWMRFFLKNIHSTIKICMGFSGLAVFLCGGYLLLQLLQPKQLLRQHELVYPLLASLLHATGYCLIIVEERYLWIICLLLILMCGYILERIFQHAFLTGWKRTVFLILLVLSFATAPLSNLGRDFNTGKELHLLGSALKQHVVSYRRLATSGSWYRSLFLAFYLQTPIYGTGEKRMPEELFEDLEKHSIDYYLTWGEPTDIRPPPSRYRETGRATCGHKTVTLFERMGRR